MTFSKIKARGPIRAILLAIAAAGFGADAVAVVPDFFNVTPATARPTSHTPTALNQIFNTGIGPYATSMDGQIYPYPMTVGGVPGADLYNGCYNRKNERLGNLDSDNSCTSYANARPTQSVFRLFIGYKIGCAGTINGGNCMDTELSINCEFRQVQRGTAPGEDVAVSTRLCSTDRGIKRRAKGNAANTPAYVGCRPGEDGSTYPVCTKCADGFYNDRFDPNELACKTCTKTVDHSTGFTLGSPVGSTSVADCFVKPGTLTCESGYTPAPDDQSCLANPPPCTLTIGVTPTNPSPGQANGSISASISGNNGTATVSITSPSARSSSNTSSPFLFPGLARDTYTLTAVDANCTSNAQVTLTETTATPECSACPPPSTLSGTNCVQTPSTSPSQVQYTFTCQGAGGCTSMPCPGQTCTVGKDFGQVSATDTTPRPCDGGSTWTSFGGSCSRTAGPTNIPGTQSCPAGFSLVAGSCTMACTPSAPPTPSPTPTGCPYSPPMSLVASGTPTGNISATLSNNVGTLTSIHWTQPATGTCTISGSTGNILNCTGVPAGSYTIGAIDPANSMCTASATAVVGSTPPPSCDVASTVATSTLRVQCQYSCGSSTWSAQGLNSRSKHIAVGERCDSPSAISRVNATGCFSATVTGCYSSSVPAYSGVYETCSTAYTCPAGQHKEVVWDVSGNGQWPAGTYTYKATCAHSSGGVSLYAGCVVDGTPMPSTLYSCPQGYKAIYYPAGTPYCIE